MKRWPNAIANGSALNSLVEEAGLPRMERHEPKRLVPLFKEMRLRKTQLLGAEVNRAFVERHTIRLRRDCPGLDQYAIETKILSLLRQTEEMKILEKTIEVARRLNREAMGAAAFDAQPVEIRDNGARVFDGCMLELSWSSIRTCSRRRRKAARALACSMWLRASWQPSASSTNSPSNRTMGCRISRSSPLSMRGGRSGTQWQPILKCARPSKPRPARLHEGARPTVRVTAVARQVALDCAMGGGASSGGGRRADRYNSISGKTVRDERVHDIVH